MSAELRRRDGSLQFAPVGPNSCLATTWTWHSRVQKHAFRHRPQSSSLPALLLLPQAWHEVAGFTRHRSDNRVQRDRV